MTMSVALSSGGEAHRGPVSTSSPAASHASQRARSAAGSESPTSGGCGPRWPPSSASSIPSGSSGRTCPVCSPADWTSYTEILFDLDTATAWDGPPLVLWVPHMHGGVCSVWPTPLAKDADRGGLTLAAKARRASNKKTGLSLPEELGGPANPDWIEWLMGFPVGWTDVGPSATP